MKLSFECTKYFPQYRYGTNIVISCTVKCKELDMSFLGYKAFVKRKGDKVEVIVKDPTEMGYNYETKKPQLYPNVIFETPIHRLAIYKTIVDTLQAAYTTLEIPEDLCKSRGHFISNCFPKKKNHWPKKERKKTDE